jgi:hypothetical protein
VNRERTGVRDLAFSQWHRSVFVDEAKAFDFDLVDMCHLCNQPLFVTESVRGNGYKSTVWTQRTALGMNVPAVLVRYSCDTDGRLDGLLAILLAPGQSPVQIGDAAAFIVWASEIRRSHMKLWHPSNPDCEWRRV